MLKPQTLNMLMFIHSTVLRFLETCLYCYITLHHIARVELIIGNSKNSFIDFQEHCYSTAF